MWVAIKLTEDISAPPHGRVVKSGAVLLARRESSRWVATFNGNDVSLALGHAVQVNEDAAAPTVELYSSARLEQYQLAPAKP